MAGDLFKGNRSDGAAAEKLQNSGHPGVLKPNISGISVFLIDWQLIVNKIGTIVAASGVCLGTILKPRIGAC